MTNMIDDSLPCVCTPNGDKYWFLWGNGESHRLDGPAIVRVNGRHEWFLNGKRYRDNKSFQKAAKLTDEEMVIMIIKYGDVK